MNETIAHFTQSKPIAVVGVSDRKMGGAIYKELKQRGYTVYPIHPIRQSFAGDACHASLKALPPEVKTAVIAVSPETAEAVVDDAVAAGFTHLWFQQGKNQSKAETKAKGLGIRTVSRKCILMYAEPVKSIHSVHRFFAGLFGRV